MCEDPFACRALRVIDGGVARIHLVETQRCQQFSPTLLVNMLLGPKRQSSIASISGAVETSAKRSLSLANCVLKSDKCVRAFTVDRWDEHIK